MAKAGRSNARLTFGVDQPDDTDAGGMATLVVHPYVRQRAQESHARDPASRLEEAVGLARAIDLEVVDAQAIGLLRVHPATYLGKGKVADLANDVTAMEIGLVVVDCDLAPVQQRNLERALKTKVIDRTGLILEIFGERAATREGELQVELAHLEYQRSRLVRSWTHLERQRGGVGFMGGPGETQIEADRRLIGERIARLKQELQAVTRTRALHRQTRHKAPFPVVALVGYTNAGKSTLFNRLTKAEVMAQDMLFATLDPTMRAVHLPSGRKIILSDTVGFISDLPPHLVAAFRATLEEVTSADLILHVHDISHPDFGPQDQDVLKILGDLGVGPQDDGAPPRLNVYNKADRLSADKHRELAGQVDRDPTAALVSALDGTGCAHLIARIDDFLGRDDERVHVHLAHDEGAALAWLYANGQVLDRRDHGDGIELMVRINPIAWARYQKTHQANTARH